MSSPERPRRASLSLRRLRNNLAEWLRRGASLLAEEPVVPASAAAVVEGAPKHWLDLFKGEPPVLYEYRAPDAPVDDPARSIPGWEVAAAGLPGADHRDEAPSRRVDPAGPIASRDVATAGDTAVHSIEPWATVTETPPAEAARSVASGEPQPVTLRSAARRLGEWIRLRSAVRRLVDFGDPASAGDSRLRSRRPSGARAGLVTTSSTAPPHALPLGDDSVAPARSTARAVGAVAPVIPGADAVEAAVVGHAPKWSPAAAAVEVAADAAVPPTPIRSASGLSSVSATTDVAGAAAPEVASVEVAAAYPEEMAAPWPSLPDPFPSPPLPDVLGDEAHKRRIAREALEL